MSNILSETKDHYFGDKVIRIVHEENLQGRDFVVGDLHGAHTLLMKFMSLAQFDTGKDRLFSVGDLVDRGPSSLDCLRLIKEPWFFPILGNHEQMLYSFLNEPQQDIYHRAFLQNGGEWVYSLQESSDISELKELSLLLANIPRVRTIKGKNKVHIVHAELGLPDSNPVQVTDKHFEDAKSLFEMVTSQTLDGDASFWKRDIFIDFYNCKSPEKVPKKEKHAFYGDDLSLIISGHTVVHQAVLSGKCLNIDTMAYNRAGGALTAYCLQDKLLYKTTLDDEHNLDIVTPFVVY
jgi:serine/threonine protein phosphatase 1